MIPINNIQDKYIKINLLILPGYLGVSQGNGMRIW